MAVLTKITSRSLADESVTAAHVQADTIAAGDLAPNSVTASELADDAVDTAAVADDAVTYAKMQNLGTGNRILGATGAGVIGEVQVATAMVADDAVTYAKMQNLGTGNRILGATGAGIIGEVQVATAMIATDAVDGTKIADDAVNSEHVAAGAIDTAHVGDDQITGAKIENNPTIAGNLTVSGTSTVTGNIIATVPTILVPANKQAVLAVNTVADGDGNTRSPIAKNGCTWMYYDFGDAAGTGTWANSGVATNVASGRRASSSSSHRMSLGSHGARTTTDNLGASYLWTNNNAVIDTRCSPGGDPFIIGTHGMTMGTCYLVNQTSIAGVIYYGDTSGGDHYFVRTNYDAVGRIKVGEDTDGSDTWHIATSGDTNVAARGYWFFVVAQTFPSGDLYVSHNGSGYVCIRRGGAVASPNVTIFGINGDGYNDNAGKHKYMNAFWSEGIMNPALIWAEWQWLKSKWSSASFAD